MSHPSHNWGVEQIQKSEDMELLYPAMMLKFCKWSNIDVYLVMHIINKGNLSQLKSVLKHVFCY